MVQIVALARTTLRNIIGTMTLKDANSERGKINSALYNNLASETKNWGLEIVRTELKEINPPTDVQETMNKVVKASNEKIAAIDFATARETQADGERRAAIKVAEGQRQAAILQAEGQMQAKVLVADGEAQAIKLVMRRQTATSRATHSCCGNCRQWKHHSPAIPRLLYPPIPHWSCHRRTGGNRRNPESNEESTNNEVIQILNRQK